MSKKYFIAFILGVILSTFQVFATTFVPIPLEKLIEESNSAAEVELKSKRTFSNTMGMIFTEYTFSVGESYNLANGDLDGDFLKITMTGGSVNGVTSYIDGAPDFEVGEKSFVLLKKVESKWYLSNFTMGKYKIQDEEGKRFYISTVFPNDSDLGKVKKERMVELIKLKFKITSTEVAPLKIEEDKKAFPKPLVQADMKRIPAQDCTTQDCANEPGSSDGIIAIWALVGLFVCSALTFWWKLKKGKSL